VRNLALPAACPRRHKRIHAPASSRGKIAYTSARTHKHTLAYHHPLCGTFDQQSTTLRSTTSKQRWPSSPTTSKRCAATALFSGQSVKTTR